MAFSLEFLLNVGSYIWIAGRSQVMSCCVRAGSNLNLEIAIPMCLKTG